ncbi:hypothetical protein TNCV_4344671 [Trichonephila clavipes]|nr:hypothetical protein TNCV_4344671 [Trichonephila clavipes]
MPGKTVFYADRKIRSSGIIWQSYGNFLNWIEYSDKPSRNTLRIYFLRPCVCEFVLAVVHVYYDRPGLPGKVTGSSKIGFQILFFHPETYPGLTFGAPALASSAARGRKNLDAEI